MSYSGKTDEHVISAAYVHLAAGRTAPRSATADPGTAPPAAQVRTTRLGARAHLAPSPWGGGSLPLLPASQTSRAPRLPRACLAPPPPPAEPSPDASARHTRCFVPGEPGPSRSRVARGTPVRLARGMPATPPPGRFH